MCPSWREDKREKRGQNCIYNGKPCCTCCSYDGCSHSVYRTISLERAVEVNALEFSVHYEALGDLDPIDHAILVRKASGESERAIATVVGFKSQESVRKCMNKFMPRLQAQLEDFL